MSDTIGIQEGSVFDRGYGMLAKKVMEDRRKDKKGKPILTIEAKAIYSYLVTFAGNKTEAYPSVKKIYTDLNISKDRFYNHMEKLINSGYIRKREVREKGKFARNHYEIIHYIAPCPDSKETVPCPDNPDTENPDTENTTTNNNSINNNITNNNNKKNSQDSVESDPLSVDNSPKFDENNKSFQVAIKLRKTILSINNRRPVPDPTVRDMESWAIEMDRLNRLGPPGANKGYSWGEIEQLIDYLPHNDFWKKNIRSAEKFRKQICRLEEEMWSDKNYKKKANKKISYKSDYYRLDDYRGGDNNNSPLFDEDKVAAAYYQKGYR